MTTDNGHPVLMQFLTLGGAVVTVTARPDNEGGAVHAVRCHGCDWTTWTSDKQPFSRDAANRHASECRSMPKPTD